MHIDAGLKYFLSRKNLAIRNAAHIGQQLSNEYKNMTYKFLLECINARKKTLINDSSNPSKEYMDIKEKKRIKTY